MKELHNNLLYLVLGISIGANFLSSTPIPRNVLIIVVLVTVGILVYNILFTRPFNKKLLKNQAINLIFLVLSISAIAMGYIISLIWLYSHIDFSISLLGLIIALTPVPLLIALVAFIYIGVNHYIKTK
jgi:hypothetical protein